LSLRAKTWTTDEKKGQRDQMESRYICNTCSHVFDVAVPDGVNVAIHCPACYSTDVEDAPPWAPRGSGRNIFEGNEWSYECQESKFQFKMPIPVSPVEEENRKCPVCNSSHLHRITGAGNLPLYCG
jgi:Zn finger protein HypA/HybF involved in hydrogenase expression